MRGTLDTGLFHAMQLFVRVADARSMTAAAARSNLTKAQVSRLVAELERRLETKLIQRNSRNLTLTAAGESYLVKCRDVLDLVAKVEGEAAETAEQPIGVLRVMCLSGFGRRYVIPLISEFLRRYPKAQVDYLTRQDTPDVLGEGIDVGIFSGRELNSSSLVAKRIGIIDGHLCAAPAYLAAYGQPAHPSELAAHRCLRLVNASVPSQWELTDGEASFRLRGDGPLMADSPEALVDAALHGHGVALVPPYAVIDPLREGKLVKVLPAWRSVHFSIFVVMPSRQFVAAKTRAWIALVEEKLPSELAHDERLYNSFEPRG